MSDIPLQPFVALLKYNQSTIHHGEFKLILSYAIMHDTPQLHLPQTIPILRNMQFDSAVDDGVNVRANHKYKHANDGNSNSDNHTMYDLAKHEYTSRGYTLPRIVFWGPRATHHSCLVQSAQNNTSLIRCIEQLTDTMKVVHEAKK